ncbi:hypothetical protein N7468_002524 [Penicillium chermesinum]|uniref:Synaptobrevin n=1 Tax=Penicillium chermesinum TaxID=63820 RepID=A0A9W9PKC3_9EURO|nr:uncharacterized protein N7468_002524 [Penicillium chermesinum]KAJ5247541.1 hypothetical protein N7468_002524 [Penicillium chermesinum]
MAVTAFPAAGEAPDLTLLNVARLFTRLEHNLLSPGAELPTLRRSEFQRMRVTKNVEYARTLLSQLERSLPQLKQPDRRAEAQTEIARDRQLLKRMETVLSEEETRAPQDDTDTEDSEWADVLSQPIAPEKPASQPDKSSPHTPSTNTSTTIRTLPNSTSPPSPPDSTRAPESSTLRNRRTPSSHPSAQDSAKATGNSRLGASEDALSAQRLEQEDLTTSLLSLASQLKASSHSFQATLDNEKSALDRAVTGMDKTSSTMEAAGQRMGMLRRMTEGKGWWGRMMLYAWIFGLWLVAVLIVFLGPKLRF